MKLRHSVIIGLVGSFMQLLVQAFYFILNTIVEYSEDGYAIYDSIPKIVYSIINFFVIIAWLLILIFFFGLLNKTK